MSQLSEYFASLKRYRQSECPIWRKNRLAARIILKSQSGPLNARDRRLAELLLNDLGIANYLLDQGLAAVIGRRKDRYRRWAKGGNRNVSAE